ncbi:MAG: NUDIX domain-containing protein [Bacteroidota bacterium]|jgi:8-oxo-dGTP diphosphatase
MLHPNNSYNLRVYGILCSEEKVLLSKEHHFGTPMLKFPGGGVEKGEGFLAALHREFMEELGTPIAKAEHFYTTDFFVESAFQPGVQLISVYYRVWVHKPHEIAAIDSSDKAVISEGEQAFLWVSPQRENAVELTFPVDRIVWNMLA